MHNLKHWFEKVNLPVVFNANVLFGNNPLIFQMNIITKGKKKKEVFQFHLGAKSNEITLVGISKQFRQVVLRIKEPARTFIVRQWNRKKQKYVNIERETPDFSRTFLMGMDESHLFISQLPPGRINSVKDAHQILKPLEVQELSKKVHFLRQGEWFFIPTNVNINTTDIRDPLYTLVEKNAPLARGRKPHVAEYRVGRYVRGSIRHPDHHALHLKCWHRFVKNMEEFNTFNSRTQFID